MQVRGRGLHFEPCVYPEQRQGQSRDQRSRAAGLRGGRRPSFSTPARSPDRTRGERDVTRMRYLRQGAPFRAYRSPARQTQTSGRRRIPCCQAQQAAAAPQSANPQSGGGRPPSQAASLRQVPEGREARNSLAAASASSWSRGRSERSGPCTTFRSSRAPQLSASPFSAGFALSHSPVNWPTR